MGQKCSAGYVKVWSDPYSNSGNHGGGRGTGDPRFGGGGGGGGGMGDSSECIAMPIEQQNNSHFQGNTSTGLQSSNVFDTTANRLGFISPIHT
tara:strand:- start:305 stop:583 length:279 start_codon:yes stop_codon:yes gene_type:complete